MQYGSAVPGAVKPGSLLRCMLVNARMVGVVLGNGLLILAKNVDPEAFLGVQVSVGACLVVDAHQHKKRVERD